VRVPSDQRSKAVIDPNAGLHDAFGAAESASGSHARLFWRLPRLRVKLHQPPTQVRTVGTWIIVVLSVGSQFTSRRPSQVLCCLPGDGHALQGDGEIVGTGIEISFDIEITVHATAAVESAIIPFFRLVDRGGYGEDRTISKDTPKSSPARSRRPSLRLPLLPRQTRRAPSSIGNVHWSAG
jgi:hypothetical protein